MGRCNLDELVTSRRRGRGRRSNAKTRTRSRSSLRVIVGSCCIFLLSPVLVDEEGHDDHDKGDETPLQDRATAPRVIIVIRLVGCEGTGRDRDGVVESSANRMQDCLESVVVLGQGARLARKEVSGIMRTSEEDVRDARDVEGSEKVFSTPGPRSFVDCGLVLVTIKVAAGADFLAVHLGLEEASETVVLVTVVGIRRGRNGVLEETLG